MKRLAAASVIILAAIIILFFLSVPHTREASRTGGERAEGNAVPAVIVRDSYRKGVHTITGTVEAPNACAAVTATAATEGEPAERIRLDISMPADTGVCLQLPTKISFSATVTAPAGLPIAVTVNGAPAATTTP